MSSKNIENAASWPDAQAKLAEVRAEQAANDGGTPLARKLGEEYGVLLAKCAREVGIPFPR